MWVSQKKWDGLYECSLWRVAWNDANFFMEQTDAKYFPQRLEWLSGMLCFAEAIKNFLNREELMHSGWNKMVEVELIIFLHRFGRGLNRCLFCWKTLNIVCNVWNGFPECFALQKQSWISLIKRSWGTVVEIRGWGYKILINSGWNKRMWVPNIFPKPLEWFSGMLCFAQAINNFLNWEDLMHNGWNKRVGVQ